MTKTEKEMETFCPTSRKDWRRWLQKYHDKKQSIWVIYYKKSSGKPTMDYSEGVDEALCYGWIDSTRRTVDAESFIQLFAKRKPNGTWSKVNKAKIERLTEEGLMHKAGIDTIEAAKKNGSWTILDEVEELTIPKDLEKLFKKQPNAKKYFLHLSKSDKRAMLQWLVLAKRPETREKRITEIVELADQGMKPKQFSGRAK